MKKIMKKIVANKALSAVLIVALTILYLLGTAAFAQNETSSSSNNDFKLDYTRDPLSFGDLWRFDEELYNQSAYAGPEVNLGTTNASLQFHDDVLSSTKTTFDFMDGYFSNLTFTDHEAPSGTKVSVIDYSAFHGGYNAGSVNGFNGDKITTVVPLEGEVAKYTVIPSSTGNYRIYVYSQENPTNYVGCWVLDSAADNNTYASSGNVEYPTFTQTAEGSHWWYATITVNATGWKAAYPGNTPGTEDVNEGSTKSDTLASNFTTSVLTNTLLTGGGGTTKVTNYYNVWACNEVLFNSLITVQWSGDIQLGTIVKAMDIEMTNKLNTDSYNGSAELTNIFGERFTIGTDETQKTWSTARVPFTLVAIPDDEKVSVLDAIEGLEGCVQNEGWYSTEDADKLTVGLRWARFIPLPEVSVTIGDKSYGSGNFYAGNNIGVSTDMTQTYAFTVALDFTNSDATEVDYVVMKAGESEPIENGVLNAQNNTVTVSVEADNVTVTLTTRGMELNRSCTVSFLPGVPGLAHNVKNLKTGVTYQFIEDALAAASSGDTIMLLGDVTFRESGRKSSWGSPTEGGAGYVVKSGVILLLPYSQSNSSIGKVNDEDEKFPYANYTLTYGTYVDLDPFAKETLTLTLTVPTGITVYNEGVISVGGMVDGNSKQGYGGVPTGAHANLALNGQLNMRSTGVLSVVGYIVGDGTVNANASGGGAKIYQLFSIMDFRGGTYCLAASGKTTFTSPVATQTGESLITPFNRFAFLGIQSTLVITKGNQMYGYCDLRANETDNQTNILFIGTDPTASLLALTADNAVLTITYDPDTHLESFYNSDVLLPYDKIGKTTVAISGNAELGYMTLSLEVMTGIGVNLGTNSATFNIPYNYAIELTNGTFSISNDMALLPGASLTVGENAQVNVAKRLHVYTGLVDARTVSGSKSVTSAHDSWHITAYPSTTELQCDSFGGNGMGNLIVDGGTLELKSGAKFSGLVQTTGSGTLKVNSGANVSGSSTYHQFGATGEVHVNLVLAKFDAYVAGSCVFTDGGRIVDPATGAITQLVAGKTYTAHSYASSLGSYTYTMYTSSAESSLTTVYTEALGATVQGAWYEGSTTAGKLDSADGAVAKVTNSAGKLEYYSSLQAAISAAADGDTVTLLKSITLNQPVASKASITLDLNGMAVTCPNGLMVNSSTMTLVLGDSTITEGVTTPNIQDETASDTVQSINVPCITNLAGATLTVDMGTAAIHWGNGTEFDLKTTVIANYGTMTISGNGSITMSDYTTGTVARTGYSIQFASVVYNAGTLTISTTLLNMTQQTNENSSVIINHKGTIELLSNATITHNNGYGLYNLGGTVTKISGGSVTGQYGIINQNITGGKASVDNGLFVSYPGIIHEIIGTQIEATAKYALINHAYVGTIGGNAVLKAPEHTVYNTINWYFNTSKYRTEVINGITHTYYNLETLPTIELITGNTSIVATGQKKYAIQNEGLIKEISATNKAATSEESTIYAPEGYGLHVYRSGVVNKIGGNTTIYTMQYGILVEQRWYTETYAEKVVAGDTTTTTTYYNGYSPATVKEITGNATITTTSTSGLVIDEGAYVETISGNVTISSAGSTLVLSGYYTEKSVTITKTNSDNSYDTTTITDYRHSKLDSIVGANGEDDQGVKIMGTASNDYAISNAGWIGSIHGKVTLSVTYRTCIYNSPASVLQRVEDIKHYNADKTIKAGEHNRVEYYHENASYIGQIGGNEGDLISISGSRYAISNGGYIGLIGKGVTAASSTSKYATIYNANERRENIVYDYAAEYLTTTEERNVQTTTVKTYNYRVATIERIQDATIANTGSYAIQNRGNITQISNCTISSNTYTIFNDTTGHYTQRKRMMVCVYTTLSHSTSYDTVPEFDIYYENGQSYIELIDGCTIKSVTSAGADAGTTIVNGGIIGTIQDSTITGTSSVISNTGVPVAKYQLLNADTYLIKDAATGKYSIDDTNNPKDPITSHAGAPVIQLIGAGNTITASSSSGVAIVNKGVIEVIDAGDGVPSKITSGCFGIQNLQGLAVVGEDGNSANISARIGMIKHVIIIAPRFAIQNGSDGDTTYTSVTIDELGEGLIAIGTGSTSYHTVKIYTNASIGKISGGDYYHKSGASYAITDYANQNYVPDPCASLSTTTRVVEVDGANYKCYYVTITHTMGDDCFCDFCSTEKHTWNGDCVCDICQIIRFYATNLNMGNNLDLMFAFPTSAFATGTDLSGYYVEFAIGGEVKKTMPFAEWKVQGIDGMASTTGNGYYVVFYSFAAKEMCDEVTVTIYDSAGKAVSISRTESIRSYALKMLKQAESKGKTDLQTLIVDMLNYGAACQNALKYPVENPEKSQLATYGLTAAQRAYATQEMPTVSNNEKDTVTFHGSNLVTTSNIKFAISFKKDSFTSFTYTFTSHHGIEKEVAVEYDASKLSNGFFVYEIEGLVVADARQPITFTVTLPDGSTEAWSESIEAYVARNASEDPVFMAFMKFADSAKTYLYNKGE